MTDFSYAAIGRSFAAILGGFATMAILVTVATAAVGRLFPKLVGPPAHPRLKYLFVNVTYSALFAALGGYVTALIARQDPLRHILMLAIAVLLLSALSALQLRGQQPVVYQFALMVLTPVAVLAGGLARMHQAGYRW